MTASMQSATCWLHANVKIASPAFYPTCYLPTSRGHIAPGRIILPHHSMSPSLVYNAENKHKQTAVCLFGRKGKSESNKESLLSKPWKSLEKAMGSFKKDLTVQEFLRQQMQKKELGGGDGGGRRPPGGGSGGSGDSENENTVGIWDEFVQVFLATLGIIFLYIFIIDGQEMIRLAKDYIKYIFGGGESMRLRRFMHKRGSSFQSMNREEEVQKDWLEQAILNTPTWWYTPSLYRRMKKIADSYDRFIQHDDQVLKGNSA